jgi:hypothetical protein
MTIVTKAYFSRVEFLHVGWWESLIFYNFYFNIFYFLYHVRVHVHLHGFWVMGDYSHSTLCCCSLRAMPTTCVYIFGSVKKKKTCVKTQSNKSRYVHPLVIACPPLGTFDEAVRLAIPISRGPRAPRPPTITLSHSCHHASTPSSFLCARLREEWRGPRGRRRRCGLPTGREGSVGGGAQASS